MDEDQRGLIEERRQAYESGRRDSRNAWIAGIVFLVVIPFALNECGVW